MAEQRLDLRPRTRADLPDHRAALANEDLLLRVRLYEQVRAQHLLVELVDLDRDRVRDLVPCEPERLLADPLRDLVVHRQIGALVDREVERPLGQQRDELVTKLRDPVAGLRAHGVERVEVAEVRRRLHLLRDVSALQPVDLVERDHDGDAERVDALRDEAVSSPDPLTRGEHEQHPLDAFEGGVDRVLHPLGERIERTLEAREIGEDELVVLGVRDSEDAAPGRLRLVGDDGDLAAAEGVHERRLAHVRAPRDRDEAGLHALGRSQESGSSAAGSYSAIEPSSRRK